MVFQINTASRLPIYQQLVQQIREAVARGDLRPDDRLPSVRQLSEVSSFVRDLDRQPQRPRWLRLEHRRDGHHLCRGDRR